MSAKNTHKPVVAICYDFDGTLSPKNMQEYNFIPSLSIPPDKFWEDAKDLAKKNGADPILSYMKLMLDKTMGTDICITRESFTAQGASVELFDGVPEWFDLVGGYGKEKGLQIEHYIISSGIKEMIEGTILHKKKVFKEIYACSYLYDKHGVATWPANVVNYTTKTQYLFRINKGIEDISDNESVNEFVPEQERRVPFSRMIYLGDGSTDIPCMKLVKNQGGQSIAVYNAKTRGNKAAALRLLHDGRVNFVAPADYRDGSEIHTYVKLALDKIAAAYEMYKMQTPLEKRNTPE